MKSSDKTRVLFVCLGNICRSPTAHGVFASMVAEQGLGHIVEVDSCGTGGWHVGEPPDARATAEAMKRGYDLSPLRARQLVPGDFQRFDYMLGMDRSNLADIQAMCPEGYKGHAGLFLSFAPGQRETEVPDPYYGAGSGFTHVLDLVEQASAGLLEDIVRARQA